MFNVIVLIPSNSGLISRQMGDYKGYSEQS